MKKRFITFFLVLCMAFSIIIPTNAVALSDDTISFEEYYAAVKAEYAKYHIQYECSNPNGSFVFTKGLLDKTLKDIQNKVGKSEFDANTNRFVSHVDPQSVIKQNIVKRSFIVDRNYFIYTTVESPGFGEAGIEIKTNTSEDIQSGKFIYINSCTSRQYGNAVNYKSWTQTAYDLDISSDREWVTGFVFGTLVVEYIEPNTGLKHTYTSDHSIYMGFTCGS